jgi:hypothetical protein
MPYTIINCDLNIPVYKIKLELYIKEEFPIAYTIKAGDIYLYPLCTLPPVFLALK